jgi:hypothetical protein
LIVFFLDWVYGVFTAWYGLWIVVVCILLAAGAIKLGGRTVQEVQQPDMPKKDAETEIGLINL